MAQILSAEQIRLFAELDRSEQAHALRVCRKLLSEGESDPVLLAAALLHDIGKIRYRLRLWERAWIVLFRWIGRKFRIRLELNGRGLEEAQWWKRALLVGECHPLWGAELLRHQGVDEQVIWLVEHHQDWEIAERRDIKGVLLKKLLQADQAC
ncbi:MAG: HD domain-containing protein [Anaerolineales bacterium]|nr:HD domain-containing protein [Anaerolineales bacterium]MCS7246946.1 HD domain-containing protein [Anaerolineales bacterium]MDW8160757.1 HD domain-containing protein [Anaerolineales bacterium]MDW8447680.1 HD domain-containing protein [Anaerolineales bacterium]